MCTAEPTLLTLQPHLLQDYEDASQSILVWQGNYHEVLEQSVCGTLITADGLNLEVSKVKSHYLRVERRKGEKECIQLKPDYFRRGFAEK